MESLSAKYIADVCGGRLRGDDVTVSGIVRDNREISGGELFCAIRGERFDGHDFAEEAVSRGARALLVSHEIPEVCATQIIVSDTVAALGEIAKAYIQTLPAKRVCITGSVGKTTTKEMCAAVLSAAFKTHKTSGNFNNNIGLPLTVFGMDKSHSAAVLEIGTNHFGEILPLAQIANPHVALITVIGESHLEAFGSREGVLSEKIEILKGLTDGGVAVLNGDDDLLWGMRDKIKNKVIWFGLENEECDVFGKIIKNDIYESKFSCRESKTEFTISAGGVHNVRDALSAIAVGRAFGMSDEDIKRGLGEFKNTGMRQDIMELSGRLIIRDCYNANPDSMRASLSLLSGMESAKGKICVLGDMLELGENAEKLHREIGEFAKGVCDFVLVTGGFSGAYKEGAGEKCVVFEDKAALSEKLFEYAKCGDAVLVKGSYSTKMWQVIENLQEEGK